MWAEKALEKFGALKERPLKRLRFSRAEFGGIAPRARIPKILQIFTREDTPSRLFPAPGGGQKDEPSPDCL